jgi:hypothetical protein
MEKKILFDFFPSRLPNISRNIFLREKEINTSAESINISFLRCLGIFGSM